MALPDPSWRVKTRRCPFYQQGRCLFSDSCNFLHVASATVVSEVVYSKPNAKPDLSLALPTTPNLTPQVIVDSPSSFRSPTRSPRTTSLLHALRDVIGDADEEEDGSIPPNPLQSEENAWSEGLKTLVNADGFGQISRTEENTSQEATPYYPTDQEEDDFEGNWTAISDYSEEEDSFSNSHSNEADGNVFPGDQQAFLVNEFEESTVQLSAAVTDNETPLSSEPVATSPPFTGRVSTTSIDLTASGLLSPIELSTINFLPIDRDPSLRGSHSFDSGYAEFWKPPIPLQSSPPRSPSVNSTFDLLSSPFGTHTSRILSHRLSAFITRSPISPARTVLSPNNLEETEEADLSLDSPSVYHSNQRENAPAEEEAKDTASNDQDETYVSHTSLGKQLDLSEGEDEEDEQDSFGHTSIWDPEGGPTAVFMGNDSNTDPLELSDTIEPISNASADASTSGTPVEIETNSASPSAVDELDPAISSPLEYDLPVEEEGDSEDETAFLAYLKSPMAQTNENDTLNSFYDIYSDIASEPETSPIHSSIPAGQSIQDPTSRSSSSTPASSLRERVFTPPPPSRQRSGTIMADSPTSLSSAVTSLDSMSRGRASPHAIPDTSSPITRAGRQSPFGQDVEMSRKVPFGFKNSFSLGKASRSSLMMNRGGKRSVPGSPLQIQTDVPESSSRPSSSNHSSTTSTSGLKPLRLSTMLTSDNVSRSNFQSRMPLSAQPAVSSFHQSGNHHQSSIPSSYVPSNHSLSENHLLSSARSSPRPLSARNSLISTETSSSSPSPPNSLRDLVNHIAPRSAPATSWRQSINYSRPSSRLSQQFLAEEEEEDTSRYSSSHDPYGETIRRPIPSALHTAPPYVPAYAVETPKPTLMFAIASDNVDEVKQVLSNGEADPNEAVGPQSALLFALTNDKLANRLDIVKTLLAYGADPSIAKNAAKPQSGVEEEDKAQPSEHDESKTLMHDIDPATRYYLERAESVQTRRMSVLIQRSFFKPLTRVRYELVGQDRALEQLFRVLSMRDKEYAITPMVVMMCGPSGHGKSLLARKFGSLLDVPTHTVNMTTLRSTHDLWQSYSMSPYEEPTTCTLAEFLINNEGKRCVVVLDEIEKTADQNTLWSLLMPWELGRCSFEAGSRHVDVKNVIWLGTSNIGHDLVFSHRDARKNPEEPMSRQEYVELMSLLRPQVSERLGASVLSRTTTVLPFVPFSMEEKRAICSEALYTLGGEFARSLPQERVEAVIDSALASFIPAEGARSLSRAISNELIDIIE